MTTTADTPAATDSSTGTEQAPLLIFLSEAGFPEELRKKVDLATRLRPAVRELTDFNALLRALRATRRQLLGQLADELIGAVAAAARPYPRAVREEILRIVKFTAPCPATVYAAIFTAHGDDVTGRIDMAPLVHALCSSPPHLQDGISLKLCPY